MIFLDSNVLIAASNSRDEKFEVAKSLLSSALQSGETIALTSHIFDETLTYIRMKVSVPRSEEAAAFISENKNIEVMLPDSKAFNDALVAFRKFKKLSFCDALSVSVMNSNGIKKILSFDSDFDAIPGITRLN